MKSIAAGLCLGAVMLHHAAPVAAQEARQASLPPVVKAIYVEVERGLLIDSRLAHGQTGPYIVEIQRGNDKAEFIRLPAGVQPAALVPKPAATSPTVRASSASDTKGDPPGALLAGTPACIPGIPGARP